MEWRAHLFTHRLGSVWQDRSELTSAEQSSLRVRMVLNYYGFWMSKVAHAYLCYKAYKWGMFAEGVAERRFWMRLAALNIGVIMSLYYVDRALKNQLFLYCEHLREKYSTGLDQLRLDYLGDKVARRMTQAIELERLSNAGKQVQVLIDITKDK